MAHAHSSTSVWPETANAAFAALIADLTRIFDRRLRSLVAYGDAGEDGVHTLALVDQLTFADLAKCVPETVRWHRAGLATPLIVTTDEFRRTVDVFPLEYGDIIDHHVVLAGGNPFANISVRDRDLRSACERQAKSHLIHLREGFLETGGQPAAVARLIGASGPGFRTLVTHIERLEPGVAERLGISGELVDEVLAARHSTIADPTALLARYLAAVERLWQYVDAWRE
jgi:hypothetical protein